ncbi:MAG TPA: glycosyltransferase [Phototrophicaceae bacterium]|nr:glycosyltransferase [Phototrophicaceae bacterium]
MQILLLTPSLPYPPHQGGALRNFGLLRGLHDLGHSLSLLSFHDGSAAGTPLSDYCQRVETVTPPARTTFRRLRDLFLNGQPDLARRLESPTLRDRLRDLLRQTAYDLIQFEGLEMAIYLPFARQLQPSAKLIYDAHNAEYALQSVIADVETKTSRRLPAAIYSRIQARRIARFERSICAQADAVIAVSPEDADALKPFRADHRVFVLPNGIATDEYAEATQKVELGGAVLVFTGKMDYRPNVDAMQWFTGSILPRVRVECPDARLYIVGQKPHASLQTLREDDHVEVTGWVAQVQPFLHAAQVFVAPLRMGSGTRLKILEAMASGCAVVATSAAVAGLDSETRSALLIADTDADFADDVIALLKQPDQRVALGQQAQQLVGKRYDWSALIPTLIGIYREIGLG